MKLKDCKPGFYKEIHSNYPNCIIYHVFENDDTDKEQFPLLIDTYEYEDTENGINRFESYEDGVNPEFFDDLDVEPINKKLKVVVSEYNAACIRVIEDKLNNEQLLEKIRKMAEKEVNNGAYDDKNVKFALRILRALEK